MGKIAKLYPAIGLDAIDVKGKDIIKIVGQQAIKDVVISLMCGENIRNTTEPLTRRRLSISNGSLLLLLLNGCQDPDFLKKLPSIVLSELLEKKNNPKEKQILQWLLGLTTKSFQNVLRSKVTNVDTYIRATEKSVDEALVILEREFGKLGGSISVDSLKTQLNWLFIIRLFTAIGAQTLAVRGSEKSIYGKLFERLVLGSLLEILGFKMIDPKKDVARANRVFWLSERGNKRESDATLLVTAGNGVRFDIGFIGPGNTEISLDKVSRFERTMDFGQKNHFMLTFVIVDRIGKGSRIVEMAKEIDGTIIQMSLAYWPVLIAQGLKDKFGYSHKILGVSQDKLQPYFIDSLKKVDLLKFL